MSKLQRRESGRSKEGDIVLRSNFVAEYSVYAKEFDPKIIGEWGIRVSSFDDVKEDGDYDMAQPLQETDSDQVGLEGYRKKEMKAYKKAIASDRKIVMVNAPSRAGKSESIFGNIKGAWREYSKKVKDFLKCDYVGLGMLNQNGEASRSPQETLDFSLEIGGVDSGKKIVVLDEFHPNEESDQDLLRHLLEDEEIDKVVVCMGGNFSNSSKRDQVLEIGGRCGFTELDCALVEFGLKPLNITQFREMFEFDLDRKKKSIERQKKRGKVVKIDEDDIERRWKIIEDNWEELPPIIPELAGKFASLIFDYNVFDNDLISEMKTGDAFKEEVERCHLVTQKELEEEISFGLV